MHISIFVYGTWGDMRPHVVLGQALKEKGHSVQVIASGEYEQWVRDRNLDFFPFSLDWNVFSRDHASLMDENIFTQLKALRTQLQPIFTQMGMETLEATRDSDILMTVEFGVSLIWDVLQKNNLRTILINPAPLNPTHEAPFAMFPSMPEWFPFTSQYNQFTYRMLHRTQWSTMAGSRNRIAEHLGVPKATISAYRQMLAETPALTIVSKHVFERPSDWQAHHQVTGYLFDEDPDWRPPQDLQDFLDAGEAPVYIGFGSMPDSKPQQTTQLLIEAVKRTGKRAVILSGWAGLGADSVPDNMYILKYAPHNWLFPKMSALIHHGGAGTTASGFLAGVPMTMVPHNGDQGFWGRRVKELGIGTEPIPRKKITVENIANTIQELTTKPSLHDHAQELSAKIKQEDGLSETVEWFERVMN